MKFFTAHGISVALSVTDNQNIPVVWSEVSFTGHLIQHPDRQYLDSEFYINVIETTIQQPFMTGVGKHNCTVLYSEGMIDQEISDNSLYMKVVVAYDFYPAQVKTAFLTDDIRGATMVL